jgi:hypothetical protein
MHLLRSELPVGQRREQAFPTVQHARIFDLAHRSSERCRRALAGGDDRNSQPQGIQGSSGQVGHDAPSIGNRLLNRLCGTLAAQHNRTVGYLSDLPDHDIRPLADVQAVETKQKRGGKTDDDRPVAMLFPSLDRQAKLAEDRLEAALISVADAGQLQGISGNTEIPIATEIGVVDPRKPHSEYGAQSQPEITHQFIFSRDERFQIPIRIWLETTSVGIDQAKGEFWATNFLPTSIANSLNEKRTASNKKCRSI